MIHKTENRRLAMSAIEDGAMQHDDLVRRAKMADNWPAFEAAHEAIAAELTRLREHNAELEKERDEALNMLSTTALMNASARIASLEVIARRMRVALDSAESYLGFLDSCDEGSPIVLENVRAALASSESVVKSEGEKDGE
jgi:hypothetical protein